MSRPVYSTYWDNRRGAVAHKIAIEGTNRFLLFTDETLSDLLSQIEEASKGTHRGRVT
ncbi:hypothetical protein NLB33_27030 [Mycolicibacterium smegmatis]|uniref:hypothetical protein n=1 Tax=Mycolicibacterium smegmatis TaxID=1772 RepID=UPI0020A4F7B8|nr:hypothetical protein [Mycolicibacterium smegmatis]MCP2626502.1 hypothetical protein [Mycolicibacterium smegmatis]